MNKSALITARDIDKTINQKYKADTFAIKAGFGPGLLSFLEKLKDLTFDTPHNLLERLYASHPPVMLRIGRIEEEKNQNR